MKKILVVSLFVLAVAGMAGAVPPAAPVECKSSTPITQAPAPFAMLQALGFTPKPEFLTGCTATVDCPLAGGTTTPLSCSGTGSCSVGAYWVTCDGHSTYCGCVGCDLCRCDCFAGGGTGHECFVECKFNC